MIETYFNASELSDMKLKTLAITERMIKNRAKTENWQSRPRQGRGGGVEYALNTLPPEVQQEILRYNLITSFTS